MVVQRRGFVFSSVSWPVLGLSMSLSMLGCAGDVVPPTDGNSTHDGLGSNDDDEHVGGADDDVDDDDDDNEGDTAKGDGDGDSTGDGDAPTGDGDGDGDGDTSAGTDPTRPGFRLVWSDEFDGDQGALPSQDNWKFDVGGDGWGNNQLEFDTDRAENASLDGQGHLLITAKREDFNGRQYTSARMNTAGKFEQAYGRFEARMRLPEGQGVWPAFWMLGDDIGDVNWPTCGEIDILENLGHQTSRAYGTIHGPGYSGGNGIGATYDLPNGAEFPDDFHVFAVEWEPEEIRWYVDDALYETRTPDDLPDGTDWVYDHPFFIILNLAIGGNFPGDPDGSTVFPQTLTVDHVRVYEQE
jgi:beta-glucanase (GH16 family)